MPSVTIVSSTQVPVLRILPSGAPLGTAYGAAAAPPAIAGTAAGAAGAASYGGGTADWVGRGSLVTVMERSLLREPVADWRRQTLIRVRPREGRNPPGLDRLWEAGSAEEPQLHLDLRLLAAAELVEAQLLLLPGERVPGPVPRELPVHVPHRAPGACLRASELISPGCENGGMQPRANFDAAADAFLDLVGAVPRERYDGPGLGDWDLRSLIGHTGRSLVTVATYLRTRADTVAVA